MEDLEDLQFLFIRTILETGKPTPKTALLWETGLLGMEERISKRKLEFIDHIKESDENTLVKKVFNEQLEKDWPGLIQECDKICEDLELPKVSKNKLSKRNINNALHEKTRNVLLEKMKTSSKMEDKVEEASWKLSLKPACGQSFVEP